jgi:hypothetical protein
LGFAAAAVAKNETLLLLLETLRVATAGPFLAGAAWGVAGEERGRGRRGETAAEEGGASRERGETEEGRHGETEESARRRHKPNLLASMILVILVQ